MKKQVVAANEGAILTLAESRSLFDEQMQVDARQRALSALKDHFVMSDEEIAYLTSTAEPVDDRFFSSLLRAKQISQDCEVLLGLEGQTLGTDLMEQSSKNINFGFQKLCSWVQREFKTLDLENPQMNSSIRRALRVLAERPSLFQSCLDFLAGVRERTLSHAFHIALTGTTSLNRADASLKPIDLAAHNPIRYVGDMLAWIHSTTVSEREALEVIFVVESDELARVFKLDRDAEVWQHVTDECDNDGDFGTYRALDNLVDREVTGALKALRQRVEQVVRSNEDAICAYDLAMLIKFYRITFQKLLGTSSNLVGCVASLEEDALRQFRALIRDHIAALHGDFQQAPSDLGPPQFLVDSLRNLSVIMKTNEASLSSSEDRENDFEGVLTEAFEPFMTGCDNMAQSLQLPSNAIFLINCRQAAVSCLKMFTFTGQRTSRLIESIRSEAAKLVKDQHYFYCYTSGLAPLLNRNKGLPQGLAKPLTKDSLLTAGQQLDDFLPSAMMDAMERMKLLQDTTLAQQIIKDAADWFCKDFEGLEQEIERLDTDSGAAHSLGLRSVFPRTTAEIRVLLS